MADQEPLDLKITHPLSEMAAMFFKNYAAVAGLVLLIFIILFTFVGPLIHTTDPFEMVWAPFSLPGEEGFLLGTDYLGRDILAAMMVGGQVSMAIGLSAAIISVVIGVTVGAFAGYYGGVIEEGLMRFTEFFQVLPTLLFSMVIVALFGATLLTVTMAIGVVSWTAVARVTRSEFLRIRELEYVSAARSCSARGRLSDFPGDSAQCAAAHHRPSESHGRLRNPVRGGAQLLGPK